MIFTRSRNPLSSVCAAALTALMALPALAGLQSCSTRPEGSSAGARCEALPDSLWDCSQWISAAQAPVVEGIVGSDNFLAADGASWFVCEIPNEGRIKKAVWMTTGLGVYDIFIGGTLIGEEVLRPGFTHREKTKLSLTYDVTDAVQKAKGKVNVFSAQVTPGWWADKIVTPGGHDGMIGRKCAFRSVLQLTYADGATKVFGTNTSDWKAGIAGPVKHAGIFDGEYYDARELPGWECAQSFPAPEENTEFPGKIFPTDGAEVYQRPDIALSPVQAYCWKDIEGECEEEFGKVVKTKEFSTSEEILLEPGETLVVDFGQNAAAVPSFCFKAAEGTVLTCLPSEILNDGNGARSRGMDGPEGSCHRTNLRLHEKGFRLEYTFGSGESLVDFTPRATFFGYRYISVTSDAPVLFKSIRSIPVTSIAKDLETGFVTTGDESINKLISNTIWGQRSNYLSVPTDCPQRDERLGWTADTQVFTQTGAFFANTAPFFHKWTRDLRDSRHPLGGYPGVAPLAQYGWQSTRLGWSDAGVIVPWTIWKQFGDASIVDENWDAMAKYLAHIDETRYDHEALRAENKNFQWADWLSYEALESCSGVSHYTDSKGKRIPKPETLVYWNYLSACYWAMDAAMMRDMAAATGRDASLYEEMHERATQYLKSEFLLRDGSFKLDILNTMQTPALFALYNGLVEGEAKEALKARLRENFASHDGCLQTGFLGTSILLKALTDNGMSDIAIELLHQRKNPSWLYSVDNGATTIWERWNSYTIEDGMGPKGMNSFNHYAYGCVCQWIWESLAGIESDPANPGFRHIIMKPVPDKALGFLKAEYKSAAGLIKSSWSFEGDLWNWEFTVPEGCTATVTLPGGSESRDYGAGTWRASVNTAAN